MPITYYPERVQKRPASAIDILQKANRTYAWEGGADLDAGDMNAVLWPKFPSWSVKQVHLYFSTADAKDYSIAKLVGRGIIAGLNDKLWIKTDGAPAQEIVLSPGFYDNDSNKLVDELAAQLNANAEFIALGLTPFTVTFTEATGLFEIAPTAGDIKFLFTNEATRDIRKTSTGGPVFGLTANSVSGASIVSDSTSFDFGQTFEIVSDTGSAATDVSFTDDIYMSVDDALLLSASGDMIASYLASYKEE